MKILIVDDDPVTRRVMRQILAARPNREVVEAEDGVEAWLMLQNPSHGVDAAFVDLSMPDLDGLDLIERMQELPTAKGVAVILCTASRDRDTVVKAAAAGIRHYIVKPPVPAVIELKLQQALGAMV